MTHLKKSLSLLLAVLLCLQFLPLCALAADESGSLGNFAKKNVWNDSLFEDVAETDWFRENVRSVYEYGLMVGKGDGIFDPSGSVTVAEILSVAARLHAVYHTGSDAFAPTDPWYAGYAAYCAENGIVSSLPEDLNAPAARGLVAGILGAALPETEYEAINSVADGSIPDVAADDVCGPAVYRLYRAGVVVGNDEKGTFAPYSYVKRCEVAAILTRIVDKSLRLRVTLTAPETAPAPSADPKDSADSANTSSGSVDTQTPSFDPAAFWEAMLQRIRDAFPWDPEEPADELTAAYDRLVREQGNCHLTELRTSETSYRSTWEQLDYDYDGQYVHAVYNDKDGFSLDEFYFRDENNVLQYGVENRLGSWCYLSELALKYPVFDFPVFPAGIDSSLYEDAGDGWYQATEEARTDEALRIIEFLAYEYSASTHTVEDFRIQVKNGRVAAISLSYTAERWSITSYTNTLTFSKFGEIEVDFPDSCCLSPSAEDLLESWSAGEDVDGMSVYFSGYVIGFLDGCAVVMDLSKYVIPVYLDGMDLNILEIGDAVELIGTVDCSRFRGGVPAIAVDDPDKLEYEMAYIPSVMTEGDDLEELTDADFDLVDFTCLFVPQIPDEAALKNQDYTVEVHDAYGNKACLYLGDSSMKEQSADGFAADFRAGLRTFIAQELAESGGTECMMSFASILLTDKSVFAPTRETQYEKSEGPNVFPSPAVRTMLPDPDLTLEEAVTGLYVVQQGSNETKTAVTDLPYECPGFDPAVPGDYPVSVTYKGLIVVFTIRVLGDKDGVYLDAMDADKLADLKDLGYESPSLPAYGNVNILVIPVRFTDSPDYDVDLEKAFNSTDGSTGWYSLTEYYSEISFGKLTLHADILPAFDTGMDIETADNYGMTMSRTITRMAVEYYDDKIDYNDYDQNGDGNIDCVYLVYDAPLGDSQSEWWAFNSHAYGEYDGLDLYQYVWISAETFLADFWIVNLGSAPEEDTDGVEINCRVLIHETGHALGLPDLYGNTNNPTGDTVMMCGNLGDFDPLAKSVLGWIQPSFDYGAPKENLILTSYTTTGAALIISPDEEESYFKDYYFVMLYTPDGVNAAFKDRGVGIFSKPGIVIYRIRGELDENSFYNYFDAIRYTDFDRALVQLIQNNGRDTLRTSWSAVATDEDLYLPGDSYTFTWPAETGGLSMTLTVNVITQGEDGAWTADISLK